MFRIIISIAALIVLSAVVIFNASYVTTFNLFGQVFENIPVIVVAIVSFIIGILYSFTYYVHESLRKFGKARAKKRTESISTGVIQTDTSMPETDASKKSHE